MPKPAQPAPPSPPATTNELTRLAEDAKRTRNWKRWGPYLSQRQWGTVREDYSADGTCWDSFPHDHARSRAYRWGEDGLLGISDRECRLCFAVALWNGKDPILKERLFGLSGTEGNHGEDVKEEYYFLDATPTGSYLRALYKYPHAAFPYVDLLDENRRRGKLDPEYELVDTGIFADRRYHDVEIEYAKADCEDILIRITVSNRGPEAARLHLLPTLWFRNTWSWGCAQEGCGIKPRLAAEGDAAVTVRHPTLGVYRLDIEPMADGARPPILTTENETNAERLYGFPNASPWTKDAFHAYVVEGKAAAVNPDRTGTKAAAHYRLDIPAGASRTVRLRLSAMTATANTQPWAGFDEIVAARRNEADQFYAARIPPALSPAERAVSRQAYAGLLWSKQFYHYVVRAWLDGDPEQPPPPEERKHGRNAEWTHLYNRDLLSMPDSWEYPWYAAWDLAFHMIPFARIDPDFAKSQLLLLLREWYMHPNGQIPAYEFAFGDVNPPVHAWACWRVYKIAGERGKRDRAFLERAFHKLLLNFTWWVNRKDPDGRNLFAGGFLGLDNIGVFDRSKPLPTGGRLDQADGTAWMAFFCGTMLSIALELAAGDPVYEDIASKFFEHFVAIIDAMNRIGGHGLWDDEDGFYYDQLLLEGHASPLRTRSMVGLVPLIAVEVIEAEVIDRLPGFKKRMQWFLDNRPDLSRHVAVQRDERGVAQRWLLAVADSERLARVLRYALDESEFLSPYGLRSLSRVHRERPFELVVDDQRWRVAYTPGESDSGLFGGNSNWRGPVWFPLNYLIIEALERYNRFNGGKLLVESPVGSGRRVDLGQVALDLHGRLAALFLPGADGKRPCHGDDRRYADDPHWRDLVLFYEHFHGDTGRGIGASHQTGWTALAASCLEAIAAQRTPRKR